MLKSLPGLFYVIRWFVPNFERMALPLNDSLQIDEPFNFDLNENELEAVKSYPVRLISPPVLLLQYVKGE